MLPERSKACPDKTRADLEWGRVLEALAARSATPMGKRLALTLPFAGSRAEAEKALTETREASALAEAGEPLPLAAVADVEASVERARIGATLSNEELRGVLGLLGRARVLRRFLASRKERAPELFASAAFDPSLDDLERVLERAFDPDGTLSDRASPRLEALRAERRAGRDRLVRRLDEFIKKHGDILQDAYWTERDGRYVLPVRADAHERFPGIVHATSASGATLFVEPRVLVEAGNRQKMLDAQVVREEEAIYAALSSEVAEKVESVAGAARALALVDVRASAARLREDLGLSFPIVPGEDEPFEIELLGARHPILVLDGIDVVPSDLSCQKGRAVVVSGPNAGGKTVALKTLGLAALMVRAGLPVPAAEGSRASIFEAVLTDVGDDQSLRKNLSTFSAHVQNLAGILDETRPGVLVLLDELAGGTDPREGEALAAALLDSLCARGGAVVCTTHYEGLKALALADPRFSNASVGFDMKTMSPTFRLHMGVPGASSALAVARRFGIPGSVLERAASFMDRESRSFEETVEKLAQEQSALELARADAVREAEGARARQRALDAELSRLKERERGIVTKESEALLQSVRRAREELRVAQAKLRGARPDEAELRAAAKIIDAVGRKTSLGGELEPRAPSAAAERAPLDPAEVRIGARVYVPRIRAQAEVVEVLSSGQVRVAAGPLKITTTREELRRSDPAPEPREARAAKGRGAGAAFDAAADPDVPIQTEDNTVDLRGLRAHEAVGMAEQFLDRCLGAGRKVAFLVHGHGTGALRDAVRDAMRASPYVARARPGGPGEGGDGVTVVWLR